MAQRRLQRMYNQGLVTSRPKRDLRPGEMQQATGIYYKQGDPKNAYKLPGRSQLGSTGTSKKVDGLALCLFDSGGTDLLLALSNSVLYSATPGFNETFSTLYSPSTSPTSLDAAHAADTWYLAMGTENRVLKSDGTTRAMSMKAPGEQLTLTTATTSLYRRADADDAGWSDMALAYDSSTGTSAYASRASSGSTAGTWTFAGGASNTGTGRKVSVLWGVQGEGGWFGDWWGDSPGGNNLGAIITVKMELSEDGGSSFTTIGQFTMNKPKNKEWASADVTDAVDVTSCQVKCTLTYSSGTKQVTFLVYDIVIKDTGSADTNTATEMLYSYREWNETDQIASAPAPAVSTTFTSQAAVLGTLPSAAVNSATTHWQILRGPSGGTLYQMGIIDTIPVADSTFIDDFSEYGVNDQPGELVPYIEFVGEQNSQPIRIPRDGEAPNLSRISYFKGGLVGLSPINTRALYYTPPGFPESWPALYFINSFPLPEHDELVDVESIGGSLIIGAKGTMIRLDEVPRSSAGVFIASPAEQIKGAPGCVGPDAMTAVNYGGISNVAWISPENGVLVTDGDRWESISDDLDWSVFDGFDKSGWVLTYLKHLRAIRLDYSSVSGGTNDRFYLLHLDKLHLKPNGQAKVTGPHYGKAASIAAGQVSSKTRVYTGHTSDGKVYIDFDTSVGNDLSGSYNSDDDWPLIVKGGRWYGDWGGLQVNDAVLYHGNFGLNETCAIAFKTGRDASESDNTKTKTVSLYREQGHQVDVSRGSEWFEETITHTGVGASHLSEMLVRVLLQGDEGEMKVVQ